MRVPKTFPSIIEIALFCEDIDRVFILATCSLHRSSNNRVESIRPGVRENVIAAEPASFS